MVIDADGVDDGDHEVDIEMTIVTTKSILMLAISIAYLLDIDNGVGMVDTGMFVSALSVLVSGSFGMLFGHVITSFS